MNSDQPTSVRVLVVDDSATIRQMLTDVLTEVGYAVTVAEDGASALEAAMQNDFALVLTDVIMPRVDGLSLVAQLRAMPSYRRTPILVVTTETSPDLKKKGKEAGATGWITKPFSPTRLLSTIRLVLP